jgi:hypothetical protein
VAFRRSFAAPAAPLPLPGPELEVRQAAREGRAVRIRAWLRSPRGAPEAQLALPPCVAVLDAAVGGAPAPRPPARVARWFGDWTVLRHATLPPGGAEVELLLGGPGPFEVEVADVSPGLPPEAARVAAARPPDAVTVQEGDVTLVTRPLRLEVR